MSRKIRMSKKQLEECLEKIYEQTDGVGEVNITPKNPNDYKDRQNAITAAKDVQQRGGEVTTKVGNPDKAYNVGITTESISKKQIQEMRLHRMIFESDMYTKKDLKRRFR